MGLAVQQVAERAQRRAGFPQPRVNALILTTAIDGLRLEQLTAPSSDFAQRVSPVVGRLLGALTTR